MKLCSKCKNEVPNDFNFCNHCGNNTFDEILSKEYEYYLHAEQSSNRQVAEELGLSERATNQFIRTCYEVKLTLKVDMITGNAVILEVNDTPLVTPVYA